MEGSYRQPSGPREPGEGETPRRPPPREGGPPGRLPTSPRPYGREPETGYHGNEERHFEQEWAPRPRPPLVTWLALLLGVVIAVALFANAAANNYSGCVQAVTAKYGGATDSLSRLGRNDALSHCSHSPF